MAALEQAKLASEAGEVPVGAVIVRDGQLVASAHNETRQRKSPLAHAEIICMERAALALGAWRLLDCSMYITTEPCPMCAGELLSHRPLKSLICVLSWTL
jgi:tRNA(adenine34) deaminase